MTSFPFPISRLLSLERALMRAFSGKPGTGSSRTPTDNSNYQPKDNAALAPLIAALPQVQEKGSKVGFRGLAEAALMSGHTEQYASYSGSLTTPPCSQAVHWINFLLPLHISSSQLAQFR